MAKGMIMSLDRFLTPFFLSHFQNVWVASEYKAPSHAGGTRVWFFKTQEGTWEKYSFPVGRESQICGDTILN